jgi:hypothetical protein
LLTPDTVQSGRRRSMVAVMLLGASLIQWEFPRLCRGGSRSLTFPGVVPGFPSMKLRIVSRQSTRIWSSIDGRARKPKPQQVGV